MRFVRISSLITGLLMIGQWSFFLVSGNVPEFETEPVSILFHIIIELITAVMLVLIFFLLKPQRKSADYYGVFVQGMLCYTVINSSGYFAQSGEYLFLFMFTGLLAVSIINTVLILKKYRLQE